LIGVYQEGDIFIYDRMKKSCVVVFDPAGKKPIPEPQEICVIESRQSNGNFRIALQDRFLTLPAASSNSSQPNEKQRQDFYKIGLHGVRFCVGSELANSNCKRRAG
jgi:hypothetical protein